MREEGAADQIADAAGLEGGGGLEVLEFEEDAAGGLGQHCGEWRLGMRCVYHPAALERAADSTRGVETQGLGRSENGRLPMDEESWAIEEMLSIQMCGNSRVLKSICKVEQGGEKRTPPLGGPGISAEDWRSNALIMVS